MPNTRISLAFLGAALASLPALAISENRVESFIIDDGKHPTAHQHVLVVSKDSVEDVYACLGYAHDREGSGDVGFNKGTISVSRSDPETGDVTIEKLNKRGNLNSNKWLRCVKTGPVHVGDTVVFDYAFGGYARPRGNTIHIRSSLGKERMLIKELRGPEATGDTGDPTQFHQRTRTNVSENGKHPKTWLQASVVANNSVGKGYLCLGYGNNFKKGNTGSAVFKAEIGRTDPETGETTIEKITRRANLKKNKMNKCAKIDPVRMGDTLVVDIAFGGFPRLRGNAKRANVGGGDTFQVKTGIGPNPMLDSEIFGPAPEDETGGDDGGGGDTNPPPPPSGGALSAADHAAILRLFFSGSPHSQLWRPKANQLGKFTAIGPGTRSGSVLNVDPNTVGQGNTIAAAVADYERKRGQFGTGSGSLSSKLQNCLVWYGTINPAGGSTSIRFGPGGSGWHAEFYRPSTGTQQARYPNMEAACVALQNHPALN